MATPITKSTRNSTSKKSWLIQLLGPDVMLASLVGSLAVESLMSFSMLPGPIISINLALDVDIFDMGTSCCIKDSAVSVLPCRGPSFSDGSGCVLLKKVMSSSIGNAAGASLQFGPAARSWVSRASLASHASLAPRCRLHAPPAGLSGSSVRYPA
eukprot:CAMPEP_0170644414 /NCGR_PEP_ID=MMETSP0224-20130122/42470_1 /TAXON_ID=285029 /ORGANISM="Togula jolla, Strain CCCM 725" /LENGTH=154 /DNA_ID=CAMNT_0010975435 /DNA_START=1 /DNA_END=466 /DNA_ORIENTATION=-